RGARRARLRWGGAICAAQQCERPQDGNRHHEGKRRVMRYSQHHKQSSCCSSLDAGAAVQHLLHIARRTLASVQGQIPLVTRFIKSPYKEVCLLHRNLPEGRTTRLVQGSHSARKSCLSLFVTDRHACPASTP